MEVDSAVDSASACSRTHEGGKSAFDNLLPAIVQCFFIICIGYITGRLGKISASQARGIGTYISTFALPALLFKSMVELNFSEVNWKFLASIAVSKAIVFVLVMIITLVTARPLNLGKAGLYSIFTTQSNDFALGYPIIKALYETCHPDYMKYIYLLAPVSLVILNPIGFILLEIQKWRSTSPAERTSCAKAIFSVMFGILKNPIVLMTAVGMLYNVIFKQQLPSVISDILVVLSNSFSATALFYLGLNLVGKIRGQFGIALFTPVLLICAKTLLLPFISREMVNVFNAGGKDNSTLDMSQYGFLYGTIPTAPSVFLYATQYSTATDTIATGMVACTFLSAPLMFVSATMVAMSVTSPEMYSSLILETSFNISILGIITSAWVLGVFIVSRRSCRVPHQFTIGLIAANAMSCLGMILWSKANDVKQDGFLQYVQYILFFLGTLSSRCWMGALSMVLCLLRCRSLCSVLQLRFWFYLYSFGLPTFLTGLLLILTSRSKPQNYGDPAFQYGRPQMVIAVFVLALNILIVIVTLIVQTRYDRFTLAHKRQGHDEKTEHAEGCRPVSSHVQRQDYGSCEDLTTDPPHRGSHSKSQPCNNCNDCPAGTVANIEDIVPFDRTPDGANSAALLSDDDEADTLIESLNERTCLIQGGCSYEQRQECRKLIRRYDSFNRSGDEDIVVVCQRKEYQITQHLVLVLLLLISASIGLFLCFWRLLNEGTSGIYIEIEFLDSVCNFGQGVFIFGIFGLDSEFVIGPFIRRMRKWFRDCKARQVSHSAELDKDTKTTCEGFLRHHKAKCKTAIASERRVNQVTYTETFTGSDLVDWLIEAGLASNRQDAVVYGQKLVQAHILEHIQQQQNFHDFKYLYRFTQIDLIDV